MNNFNLSNNKIKNEFSITDLKIIKVLLKERRKNLE